MASRICGFPAGGGETVAGTIEIFPDPSPRVVELPGESVDFVVLPPRAGEGGAGRVLAHVASPVQAVELVACGVEVVRDTKRGRITIFRDHGSGRWVARYGGKGEPEHDTAVECAGELSDWLSFWWQQLD